MYATWLNVLVVLRTVELLHESAAAAAASVHSNRQVTHHHGRPCSLPNSRRSRARLTSTSSSSCRQRSSHCRLDHNLTTAASPTDSGLPTSAHYPPSPPSRLQPRSTHGELSNDRAKVTENNKKFISLLGLGLYSRHNNARSLLLLLSTSVPR